MLMHIKLGIVTTIVTKLFETRCFGMTVHFGKPNSCNLVRQVAIKSKDMRF